jgi:methionyl-tRNA formyltransferase
MKTLLLVGNDRISGNALKDIQPKECLLIYVDCSTSFRRVVRLLVRKSIPPTVLIKMAFCEMRRPKLKPPDSLPKIHSAIELKGEINRFKPSEIILFRAGLIINSSVLAEGVPIFNIHAANVPDFGGLGSIARALRSKSFKQAACLHIVTTGIDTGEVVAQEEYQLSPAACYCENEKVAYAAATRLLQRTLSAS